MAIHLTVFHSFFTPDLDHFREYQRSFDSWTNHVLSPFFEKEKEQSMKAMSSAGLTVSVIRLICQRDSSPSSSAPFLHWIQWRPLIWNDLVSRHPNEITLKDVTIKVPENGNGKWPQFSFLFHYLAEFFYAAENKEAWNLESFFPRNKKQGVLWMDHDIQWRDSSFFFQCFFSSSVLVSPRLSDHGHQEKTMINLFFPRHQGSDPRHHPVVETWTEPTPMNSRPGILANGCFLFLWEEKHMKDFLCRFDHRPLGSCCEREQKENITTSSFSFPSSLFSEAGRLFSQKQEGEDDEIPLHRVMTSDPHRVNIYYFPQWTIYHDDRRGRHSTLSSPDRSI